MLPYSRGLIIDNTHNYGIMKTETVFEFDSPKQNSFVNDSLNTTEPLEWIFSNSSIQSRSLKDNQTTESPSKTSLQKSIPQDKRNTIIDKKQSKKDKARSKKRKSKKINKCIIKFMKGGQGSQGGEEESQEYKGKKRRRRVSKYQKMQKKYMMPVILGLLAAKSILIPIALKALAFMSAKGLMMGFFSTVLASVISLKGMFNYPHESSKRNDDSKTQVEIIQVPTKSEDHIYYDEHYNKRGDFVPVYPVNTVPIYDNNLMKKKLSKLPSKGRY